LALLAKVWNLRRFVQLGPDTMPNKLAHHAEPVGFHVLLDGRSYVSYGVADLYLLDALYSEASVTSSSFFSSAVSFSPTGTVIAASP